ncbi:MAG: dinitrogenase iron-molybdenum cofactor biosynthesis protein [Thiobacillus sp.]|nr:dinitrogenase iron-molybdenum cofactor biosynthesis protein [Thiobacillus sp.]
MKIAITSQNRKTVTGHAGKCRKFWIYEVTGDQINGRTLLELSLADSFHESHGQGPHPLDDVNVLISGGMGSGLQLRLRQKGIDAQVTSETNPDRAVSAYLAGTLPPGVPEEHDHDHHHDHHRHERIHSASIAIPILSKTAKERT